MMDNSPLIQLRDVDIRHREHLVLRNVNLTVNQGELVYLIGRTGTGKSSLLRTLYGELPLTSGTGEVCGVDLKKLKPRNVHQLRRKLGMVFQDFGLLQDRSVDDTLAFALKATGWSDKHKVASRIEEVLTMVGLPHKGYKMPHELSGGEQQMLALGRALCIEPAVLLLDEPTEGLMPSMVARIREVVLDLKRTGVATIVVEQRVESVLPIADRVTFIENGRNRDTVPVDALEADPAMLKRYIGVD